MDYGSQFLTPDAANTQGQAVDPRSLQAALLRLSPEERKAMFEPFQEEMSGLDQQAAPQHHTTGLGAALGGIGNVLATIQRNQALHRQQANAQSMFGATYGGQAQAMPGAQPQAAPGGIGANDLNRMAMLKALRAQQTGIAPPPDMGEEI